jgi:hypothetical protein
MILEVLDHMHLLHDVI